MAALKCFAIVYLCLKNLFCHCDRLINRLKVLVSSLCYLGSIFLLYLPILGSIGNNLYLYEMGVRSAYTVPSPDPTCGITLGHPALIGRHRPFPVTHKAAERWLQHMQQALDNVTDIDEDSKIKMNFFRHTAFFLVAGDE